MEQVSYPITFTFHIGTFHNDFTALDNQNKTFGYVRQKLLKFIEEVNVYESENRQKQCYTLKADRWIDFNAVYAFLNGEGHALGSLGRKGWNSLWKAHYEIFDIQRKPLFTIREVQPWVKMMDYIFSQIPFVGILSGYLFNPTYLLTDAQGKILVRLKKEASFWGRKFTAYKQADF